MDFRIPQVLVEHLFAPVFVFILPFGKKKKTIPKQNLAYVACTIPKLRVPVLHLHSCEIKAGVGRTWNEAPSFQLLLLTMTTPAWAKAWVRFGLLPSKASFPGPWLFLWRGATDKDESVD